MAVRLGVKETAKEKGISIGKLQRYADAAYNIEKWMSKDPYYITDYRDAWKIGQGLEVSPVALPEEVSDESRGGLCQAIEAVVYF